VLCKFHKIPFYIAAPYSTFDLNMISGADIPIEYRNEKEMTEILGKKITFDECNVKNPAFDITPGLLIDGIITEKGVIYPPYEKNIKKIYK
jgi:methylthioribose-1-phosphate isomerase